MTSFFHGATAEPPSEPFPFSSSFLYVTFPPTDSLIPPPMIALPRIHPREREKSSPGSEEGRREVFFPGILGATVSHYSRSLLEAPPIFISVAPIPQQKRRFTSSWLSRLPLSSSLLARFHQQCTERDGEQHIQVVAGRMVDLRGPHLLSFSFLSEEACSLLFFFLARGGSKTPLLLLSRLPKLTGMGALVVVVGRNDFLSPPPPPPPRYSQTEISFSP